MLPKPSFMKKINNFIAKNYGGDCGKMLIHTGVIGWAMSAAAQVAAIVINDKIPKEQKLFLIPQEIADAFVNIISFYAVTQTCKSVAVKLVNTGKWLPESVRKFAKFKGAAANLGKPDFDIYASGILSPSAVKRLDHFNNGVALIATTAGSVLSCNIITPLIRNRIASRRQKKYIAKMNDNSPAAVKSVNQPFIKRPVMTDFCNGLKI